MRKIIEVICLLMLSTNVSAQLKVINLQQEADTLVFVIENPNKLVPSQSDELIGGQINLHKNSDGFLIKAHPSNIFATSFKMQIGRTTEEATMSINTLIEFCELDVATIAIIEDTSGKRFKVYTGKQLDVMRRKSKQKGDRIYIKDDTLEGYICIQKLSLDVAIKALKK